MTTLGRIGSAELLVVLVLGTAQPVPTARAPDGATALCQAGVHPNTPANVRQCAQFMRTHPQFERRILRQVRSKSGRSA